MNDQQDKSLLEKAFDQLAEWREKPQNICGDPKQWQTYCDWIHMFLNELSWKE